METTPCHLQDAAGRVEECPGLDCPFWSDGRCVIAGLRLDLGANPDLTHLLLALRARLSGGKPSLFGLLPPGLSS
jgi:hypothetical protein